MILLQVIKGDIRFQFKYGFYFVYGVFTIMYIVLLMMFPLSWRMNAGILMIFGDPTAIGLIFTGSIIHLELSEKTFESIKISPITPLTYIFGKYVSLALLSLLVALVIGLYTNIISNIVLFSLGIMLGAMIFTAFGMIIALKSKSLNQFMIMIIPVLKLVTIPGGFEIFNLSFPLSFLHPGNALVFILMNHQKRWLGLLSLIIWLSLMTLLCHQVVKGAFKQRGGGQI
jgi:fluoroquinolone transport system permease protein